MYYPKRGSKEEKADKIGTLILLGIFFPPLGVLLIIGGIFCAIVKAFDKNYKLEG